MSRNTIPSAVPEHINKMWPVVDILKEPAFLYATMTFFFKEGMVGSNESRKAIISQVTLYSSGHVDFTQFVETPGFEFNKVYLKSRSAKSIGEFRCKEPIIAKRTEDLMGDVEILRDVLNRGGG